MELTGVLLDIDGVIVTSWEPLAGAVEAVAALRDAGHRLRFVTNTTSRSAPEIGEALRRVGVALDDSELVTAGVATAELLARDHPGARCLVLNDGSMEDLSGLRVVGPDAAEDAEVVVVGSGGPGFGWDALNGALRALLDGAALVAMHGSMLWTTSEGACLDGGAYTRMLAVASGVEPTVVGKPSPEMFLAACASMGVEPSAAVMVGDDVHSDVLAAADAGLTGVLVRTGKFRPEALEGLRAGPDAVIDSVADLPAWLAAR
jgi:HAD superfamily hydrolase (TIGR01458 family)